MGNTSSQIKIIFDGSAAGLVTAAGVAKGAIKSVADDTDKLDKASSKVTSGLALATKGIFAFASAGSALQTVAGVAGSLATVSGILAVVPAVALSGAAGLITYKLAVQGVGDAFGAALANDPAKYAESVGKLAPNARDAAGAVRELAPDLKALQQSVQDDFFYGFADTARQLGATYLPVLNRQLPSIALQMGQMATVAGKALMEPAVVESLNDTLGGTADLFDGLKTAPGDVLSGIILLAGAGSGELDGLGSSVGDIAADFKQWAAEAVETGRAHEWIVNAKAELRDYGTVLGNVGSIGKTVWTGLSAGGADFSASLVETTDRLDAFLKTAEGQDALRELGETLKVTGDVAREVLLTALQELAPVIVAGAPAARELATAVGDFLVNALQTVGPLLGGVAQFLSDNTGALDVLVPLLLGAVAAYKGFQVAQQVAGWVGGATTSLGLFGKSARDAGTDADTTKGKLGGLRGSLEGLQGFAGVVAAAVAVDAATNQGLSDALNHIAGFPDAAARAKAGIGPDFWSQLFQTPAAKLGDQNDIRNIGETVRLEFEKFQAELSGATSLEPISVPVDLDTQAATAKYNALVSEANETEVMINVNGNDVPFGFAYNRVLETAAKGIPTIDINGNPVPTQDALNYLRGIAESLGLEVEINGRTVPFDEALQLLYGKSHAPVDVPVGANTATFDPMMRDGVGAALATLGMPLVPIGADPAPAREVLPVLQSEIEQPATKPINGDPAGILGDIATVDGLAVVPQTKPLLADPTAASTAIGAIDQAQTTPQTKPLLGDPSQGLGQVGILDVQQTTPQTKPLLGDPAQGLGQVDALDAAGRAPVTKPINSHDENSGSVFASIAAQFAKPIIQVIRVVQEIFGGAATGGAVEDLYPGLATGGRPRGLAFAGPVVGPGTGTSDTAGLFRLSNGEHVLTAAEVRAAGGQAAIYRLRQMLLAGDLPGFANGGSPGFAVAPGSDPGLPALAVTVKIGDQELRGMIRTEVKASDRETARIVRAGAGTGY